MTCSTYKILKHRGQIHILRRACYETPALIEFKSLPLKYREAFVLKYGDPEKEGKRYYLNDRIVLDPRANEFFSQHVKPNGEHLSPEQIRLRTMNVSILNAVGEIMQDRLSMRKALGCLQREAEAWRAMSDAVNALPADKRHTLPKNYRRLKDKLERYRANGYAEFIHKNEGNASASKTSEEERNAMLQELASDGRNLDNEMVATLYNLVARRVGWETITGKTVANWREKNAKVQYVGRHGLTSYRNEKAMQARRTAPSFPMYYWTVDGWDVELLYQAKTTDKDGHGVTTYHNRPTVVVILDPCTKYPIGYAIGSHETAGLIKAAFRNAIKHTKELFGAYYKPLQLQTDNYGRGTLAPFYEACTGVYTPAAVKNAKSKVIEPWFKAFNKYCQLYPNWSGYGVTSQKSLQPNVEWLNKNRHNFPDYAGCVAQVEHIIRLLRSQSIGKYQEKWAAMPSEDRLPMSLEDYLSLFGETTGRGNKLEGGGLKPTIGGVPVWYDSFDSNFRNFGHLNWIVKFDPDDLGHALAVENTGTSQKPEEGTRRFLLERKHVQHMALKERTPEDSRELARVFAFNRAEEKAILESRTQSGETVRKLFASHPELDGTLAKLVLCDSRGQHKDERNRLLGRDREMAQAASLPDEEYEEIYDEREILNQL